MADLRSRKEAIFGTRGRERDFYTVTPPIPKIMMVELSNGCNHACVFCANPYMRRKVGRIDGELLHRVLREGREAGVEEIGFFTTGEPFIHKDLPAITRYAKDLGYRYLYVTTNGALATPERAKAVIDAGIDSIKFSINAGTRESYLTVHGKDDFDKVMANLAWISEYRKTLDRKLALYVGFVVTSCTAHEVDDFVRTYSHLVDDILPVQGHSQYGQMSGAQAILPSQLEERRGDGAICTLPFVRLHLTWEGYLTMCCVDYHNYLAVTDLANQSLVDAWHSPEFQKARQQHISQKLEGTLCGRCWLGDCGKIEPLDARLATEIDFSNFDDETRSGTARRIAPTAEEP